MRVLAVFFCTFLLASVGGAESAKTDAARLSIPTVAPPTIVTPLPQLSQDMVDGWIRKWQKRLALEDWKIEAKVVRVSELPENAVANVHWSIPTRKATVKVLAPIDSTLKPSEIIEDTELSVVHELIHLSLAKLPLDPNHTDQEEETVRKISTALLGLEKHQ